MTKVNVRNFLFSLLAITLLAVAAVTPAFADDNDPIDIEFYKTDADANFLWDGTVSGDINGDLQTVLLAAQQSGHMLHVDFDWIITNSDCDFTARMSGTLDTQTGSVLMNGSVIDGCYMGAQVHEEGQLMDPTISGFGGNIRIMPGSAD